MIIPKVDPNLIFAENAPEQDKPPAFLNYDKGMDETRKNEGRPTIKQLNYIIQKLDQKILWIHQNGAALPYDASIDYADGILLYKDGQFVQKNGSTYTLIAAGSAKKLAQKFKIQGVETDGTIDVIIPKFTKTEDGLVPAPTGITITRFLREDGIWDIPKNSEYTVMSIAEMQAGTATTQRVMSAVRLKEAVEFWSPNTVPDATESIKGKAKIATTALSQAGTNDTDFLTPKKLRDALNVPSGTALYPIRASATFDPRSTLTALTNFGFASISKTAAGKYFLTFNVARLDKNYPVSVSAGWVASGSNLVVPIIATSLRATNGFNITMVLQTNGADANIDPDFISVIVG